MCSCATHCCLAGRILLIHEQPSHQNIIPSRYIRKTHPVSTHTHTPELRRHKRSFLKLATKVTFARLGDAGAAARLFADYLVEHVGGAAAVGGGGSG